MLQARRIVAPRRRTPSYDQQDFPPYFPRLRFNTESFPDVRPFACPIEPPSFLGFIVPSRLLRESKCVHGKPVRSASIRRIPYSRGQQHRVSTKSQVTVTTWSLATLPRPEDLRTRICARASLERNGRESSFGWPVSCYQSLEPRAFRNNAFRALQSKIVDALGFRVWRIGNLLKIKLRLGIVRITVSTIERGEDSECKIADTLEFENFRE